MQAAFREGAIWSGVRQSGFWIILIRKPVGKFGTSWTQFVRNCPFNTMAYASEPPATARSSKGTCCSRATSVSEAHRLATILEETLPAELGMPAEVMTHLESQKTVPMSTAKNTTQGNQSRFCITRKVVASGAKSAAPQRDYLRRVFRLPSVRFNSSSFCPASLSLPSAVRRW